MRPSRTWGHGATRSWPAEVRDEVVVKLSGKSALAEAFRYTIKRQEALTPFVTDGRPEADNNIAENAMRKIALGVAQLSIRRFG